MAGITWWEGLPEEFKVDLEAMSDTKNFK